MEVTFISKELRNLCLDESLMNKEIGKIASENLKACLSDISCLSTAYELKIFPFIQFEPSSDTISIKLSKKLHLLLKPGHINKKLLDSGEVDWKNVSRLQIIHVGELDD